MMQITANELAKLLNGSVIGDGSVVLDRPEKIESGSKGAVSFIANPKYFEFLYSTNSSAVIISKDHAVLKEVDCCLIVTDDAYTSFSKVLAYFAKKKKEKKGIHATAVVDASADIHPTAYVGPFVYIGENVSIGSNTVIHSHCSLQDDVVIGSNCNLHSDVKIYDDCVIGDNVIIHSGVVIGSDGFGFADSNGQYNKVPQIGNVIIEDHVEIGANTTIDRATLGSTIIKKGVKLDNLIQVAHNVVIGEDTVIAAQTGISGSTELGNNCVVGGQAGFVGHVKLAPGTMVAAQAGIAKGTDKPGIWSGSPAIEHNVNKKAFLIYRQLPELYKKVKEIERKLEDK